MDKKPTYYVVAGPNGAGKSTLSEALKNEVIEYFNPDKYAKKEIEQGLPKLEAKKKLLEEIKERIDNNKTFALETTLAGRTTLARMEYAKEKGYKIDLTFVSLENEEMHYERVANRVKRGGHDIPKEDIKGRFEGAYKNLPKAINFSDIVTIYNNSGLGSKIIMHVEKGVIKKLAEEKDLTDPLKNLFKGKKLKVGEMISENKTTL